MNSDPSVLYCTDEDICVRDPGNFADLAPADQVVAAGSDGVIASGSPWVLTSASASFFAAGVTPGCVVLFDSSTGSSPTKFAVSAVSATTLTLRRIGSGLRTSGGPGQPPDPGSGIEYRIPTFGPQIEDAGYDLNRLIGIDDLYATTAAAYLYDQRSLRQATVLTVLVRSYTSESRSKDGDWADKRDLARADLDDLKGRLVVRWGPSGVGQPSTTRFNTRITR